MLLANGVNYLPRTGLLCAGSTVLGMAVVRPFHSGISHRVLFNKPYTSFPSGQYDVGAIAMAVSYGGMAIHPKITVSVVAPIAAWSTGASTQAGAGAVTQAKLTGLKDSPCTMNGAGSTNFSVKGNGTASMTVSIGSKPSAFDIAQAVWGMDNGIENGWTPRQVMRVLAAVAAGKTTIAVPVAGTADVVFRNLGDTADVAGVHVVGSERTSTTLTP